MKKYYRLEYNLRERIKDPVAELAEAFGFSKNEYVVYLSSESDIAMEFPYSPSPSRLKLEEITEEAWRDFQEKTRRELDKDLGLIGPLITQLNEMKKKERRNR